MSKESRVWIAGGVVLDLAGAALIARSLPQTGLALGAGVALLIAGSIAIFQGALRVSEGNRRTGTTSTKTPSRKADWTPEPELQTAPPRPVRLTRTGRFSVGLWMLMAVVALGFLFLAPPRSASIPPLLEQEGVTVPATVHRKDERKNAAGQTAYFVSYNFATQEGDQVRATKSVPKEVYASLATGSTIEVIYFRYDPQQHFVPSLERREIPPVIRWAAVGLLGVLLIGFEQQRRFHRKLVSEGKPVAGVIEALRRRGSNRVFTVRFKLQGQEQTLRGSERNLQRADGDVVTVLYLPDRPEKALLYGTSLYRAGDS